MHSMKIDDLTLGGSMLRKAPAIGVVFLAMMLSHGMLGRCFAESEALQIEIQDFYYTNVPVSHAICLLAKRSPISINAVIDDTNDPPITISVKKGTVAEILQKLLPLHPGHHPHEQSGTILILPDWLVNKQVLPLTQKLTKFSIMCYSHNSTPETGQSSYFYSFSDEGNPALNVAFGMLGVSHKPDYPTFPHVRSFEDQSVLEILTTLSKEEGKSFFCYRQDKDFVTARNKDWADRKMGPTWWPNPDAPCYTMFWGTAWYGVRGKE